MAKRKRQEESTVDFTKVAQEITPIELSNELEQSMLSYSYLTIEDRALPDARDGLKPVQRRILYSMDQSKNNHNKPYVKSAKIVGNTMGSYHPHGDSAIYDAMVRMAQDFSMGMPLIDGKGNFGDRPGAGAAAARYTESRLTAQAELMTNELKEKSVDFHPNYDESTEEPEVLPAQYPNLLINGTSGIAVGYATTMAPHNPGEVIDATRWLLTHPNATVDKLMEFIPGPDFPTGGQIVNIDGAKEAYETGRGQINIRSPYEIKSVGRGKSSIEFYEFPYSVNAEKILESIKKAIKDNKIQGVADAKDLSGRNGTKFVVETKAGIRPEVVVASLYKISELEISFNFNSNALVDKVPYLLGLKELLTIFIEHRLETVTRRTSNRAEKRKERLHLIEGLLKALLDIDAVIKIVRSSDSAQSARETLMKNLKVDDVQADYILSLQLRRLTKYDQNELQAEKEGLIKEISELQELLDDEKKMKTLISKELSDVKKQIDIPRRSEILDGKEATKLDEIVESAAESFDIADEPCEIYLTQKGGLFRSNQPTKKAILSSAASTTKGQVVLITNKGNATRIETLHVDEKESKASSFFSLVKGERVIAVVPTSLDKGKVGGIAMGTAKGVIKIATPQFPVKNNDFTVMSLEPNDEIMSARWVEDVENYDFIFIKSSSNLLSFPANKVKPQGLSGSGIAGVKVNEDEKVLDFCALSHTEKEQATVLTISDGKNTKLSPVAPFPQKGRATGGVRAQSFLKGDTQIIFARILPENILHNSKGQKVPLPAITAKRDASGKPMGEDMSV